ncbi:MAG: Rne/Rng family ribonuclease [Bryobacteraceae bacterium]
MTKELVISANRHETKLAVIEDDQLVEIFFQRSNEYSLVGSVHKGRVTRVLPGMQSAFVDIGLERDAFLYVSDFLEQSGEDYERVAGPDERGERPERGERSERGDRGERGERGDRGRGRDRDGGRRDRDRDRGPRTAAAPAGEPLVEETPAPAADAVLPAEPPAAEAAAPAADQGSDRGGDRDGRRGRGRRRRRRGRGNGFPDSKYASAVDGPADDDDAEAPQAVEAATQDEEPLVLPGESIRKYRGASAEKDRVAAAPLAAEPEDAPPDDIESETEPELESETEPEDDIIPDPLDDIEAVADSSDSGEDDDEIDNDVPEDVEDLRQEVAELIAGSYRDDGDDDDESSAASTEESGDEDEAASEDEEASGSADLDDIAADADAEIAAADPDIDAAEGDRTAQVRDEVPAARYIQRGPRRIRRRGGRGGDRGSERSDRGGERTGGPERTDLAPTAPATEGEAIVEQRATEDPAPRQARDGRERGRERRSERPPMPSISELLKEGQEIIVQIAKEPLGQKGARITSHIAMPGRYVVYMPTLDHMGVSRKVASDQERLRLKRIVQTHTQGMTGGFIVRTAGEGKPEAELAADMTFLYNQWLDIRKKAEMRRAPCLLHHDLELVTRTLRDQASDQFKAVWVDNEELYESVVAFLERFQPALVNRVKLYTRNAPVFDTFNVTLELEKALRPKVWLKSGGYIVINQTEALVAIDINTGKYVGKSNRLEDTIVKTNIEAVKEIVRQVRLRDLGGIIVVDFIDMDERRNRQKVMQALEEAMRSDRAPYKILQFNDFGLVAITRRRVKQSLERALCMPCPTCEGAGYVKSVQTIIGEVLTEAHKIAPALEGKDVMLRASPEVAKTLKAAEQNYLQELEDILGKTVIVKSDPLLHPEKFDLG